jgi:molecular chaperone Hsp33
MSEEIDDRGTEVRTYFVRGRNALVARAEFSKIYIDYYLHVADCGLQVSAEEAEFARNALAAITLHGASRPRNERAAWTVNFQSPLLNVFAAGDNPSGTVVANVFSEGVRVGAQNLFYADTIRGDAASRRSVVDFEGSDFFAASERYYAHSEQRLTRFFLYGDDEHVLVAAQPDCDLEWLAGLDAEAVRQLDKTEQLALLEQRRYHFECGCTHERMMRAILPTFRQDADGLFEGDEVIRMSCPRCGVRHAITREALEALEKADSSAEAAR